MNHKNEYPDIFATEAAAREFAARCRGREVEVKPATSRYSDEIKGYVVYSGAYVYCCDGAWRDTRFIW